MRRRRLLIALVALLVTGTLAGWKLTHRHDPQLVGRWLMTEDAPATTEQLAAATDRTKFEPKTEWMLRDDGSGMMSARQRVGSVAPDLGSPLRWWTSGDRLRIRWGMPLSAWESIKERFDVLYGKFSGEPPYDPVIKYDYFIERPDLIRVEPKDHADTQSLGVLYLTRLAEGDP
jgi:hypothetical protein